MTWRFSVERVGTALSRVTQDAGVDRSFVRFERVSARESRAGAAGAGALPPLPPISAAEALRLGVSTISVPPRPPLPAAPVIEDKEVDVQDAAIEDVDVAVEDHAQIEDAAVAIEDDAATEDVADEDVDDAAIDDADVAVERDLETSLPQQFENDGGVPALSLRGLTKTYGTDIAVDSVDLDIPPGSFFALIGPNGAGKTTTLSIVAGLTRPDRGEVRIAGVDALARPHEARREVGILPDSLRTFDRLSGRQLLVTYGALRGLRRSVIDERIGSLARAFGVESVLERPVAEYSTGMRKKIMLAGAMIHAPRLLVLDEPFEGVDPESANAIIGILRTYTEHGGTVLLTSHGLDVVEEISSGVAVIVEGEILAAGTLDEVRGEVSLEERYVQLAGGLDDVEGLEWLHTFSD